VSAASVSTLPPVDYDATLVEAAVALAVRGHGLESRYRVERERCYWHDDAEERASAFTRLHGRFLAALELEAPIAEALAAHPSVAAGIERVAVVQSPSPREEGADLFARRDRSRGARHAVGIALTPETLAKPSRLRMLLRREVLHLADLLDPEFGFDPEALARRVGPVATHALRERYRALWRVSVEGRLERDGAPGDLDRPACRSWLARCFPRLTGGELDALLARVHDGPRPTHEVLLDLALGGGRSSPDGSQVSMPGSPCPLCRMPTCAFEPIPLALPRQALDALSADFPTWRPDLAPCVQCADIYRARATTSMT
jgi:hypothetical protein